METNKSKASWIGRQSSRFRFVYNYFALTLGVMMASGVVTVAVGREGDLVFLIGFAVVLTLMAWVMGYAIDVFGIRESDMSYTLDQQWAWNEKFSRFCQEEIFYPLFVKGLREVLEEFKEELGKVTEKKSV